MLFLLFLTLNIVRADPPSSNSHPGSIGSAGSNESGAEYDPWRDSNQPKIVADYLRKPLSGEVDRFVGNRSSVDNFRILVRDENFLLIGATNAVYFLNIKDLTEIKDQTIIWHPDSTDFELCLLKGKTKEECQNHIRIVAKLNPELLLVCGTHAYRPRCRHYGFKDGHYIQVKQFEGVGLTPYDPYHNSTFVVADGELYSATVSDFSGSDPLIYKEPLRTDQFDSKHLNSPDFVRSVSEGDYVFFFFREKAVEYINCGKSVYSRVARVCKSDKGGPNKYKTSWTTFLKSRLNCSLPGEYPFYFDHLQATSEVVEGEYGGQSSRLVYAVFTTPRNSIGGNAICAFRMRDLMDTFEGAFKEQESANSNWLPVPKIKEPNPRPGRCTLDSTTLPESSLSFVKSHSIMDEAVPSFFGGRPLFVKSNLQRPAQFRELTVDAQVRTTDGRTNDVLFVGTTEGRILKIVNTADPTNFRSSRPSLVEEIVLFPADVTIDKIHVVRVSGSSSPDGGKGNGKKSLKKPKLVVLTKDQVVSIPMSRCSVAAQSCSLCVALQDPYCAWHQQDNKCVDLYDYDEDDINSNIFLQNVVSGSHEGCKASKAASESDVKFAANRGIQLVMLLRSELMTSSSAAAVYPPAATTFDQMTVIEGKGASETGQDSVQYKHTINGENPSKANNGDSGFSLIPGLTPIDGSHYSAEELSMAVATSVVCALIVGFITGFLMARRCSCARDHENPYHVPYLNQSGYHGDEIYAKVDDMTYYPVNSMLVAMPPQATSTNTTVGSSTSHFHLPNNLSSSSSSSGPPPPAPPPPPPTSMPPGMHGAGGMGSYSGSLLNNSKTLSVHHPKPSDYHNFTTTVHRSQKIYL